MMDFNGRAGPIAFLAVGIALAMLGVAWLILGQLRDDEYSDLRSYVMATGWEVRYPPEWEPRDLGPVVAFVSRPVDPASGAIVLVDVRAPEGEGLDAAADLEPQLREFLAKGLAEPSGRRPPHSPVETTTFGRHTGLTAYRDFDGPAGPERHYVFVMASGSALVGVLYGAPTTVWDQEWPRVRRLIAGLRFVGTEARPAAPHRAAYRIVVGAG
ncbi:MAG: hypothetical protein HY329_04200 [Chloroflexi bacterium]|nr:hypothetical protein [Chloroflexota bacterium]